jgi:hypothetical protein
MGPLLSGLHTLICSLRGHDELLEFEAGRMFLRCASCGHASPGWQTGKAAQERQLGESRAHERVARTASQFTRRRQAA